MNEKATLDSNIFKIATVYRMSTMFQALSISISYFQSQLQDSYYYKHLWGIKIVALTDKICPCPVRGFKPKSVNPQLTWEKILCCM